MTPKSILKGKKLLVYIWKKVLLPYSSYTSFLHNDNLLGLYNIVNDLCFYLVHSHLAMETTTDLTKLIPNLPEFVLKISGSIRPKS